LTRIEINIPSGHITDCPQRFSQEKGDCRTKDDIPKPPLWLKFNLPQDVPNCQDALTRSEAFQRKEVKQTIEAAIGFTGIRNPILWHRPRLLSDNGPCYVSKALKDYLESEGIRHTRGKPYHPMTQGKIERHHRSMKNLLLLEHYYSPSELENQIGRFVSYYNNYRYHEALNNVTPADVYYGKDREILNRREQIKEETLWLRRRQNCSLRIA
jgi:hypothetical protein